MNADPRSFAAAPLPGVSRAAEIDAYAIAAVNLNNTAATRAATKWAQSEVSFAEQNLCMARHLAQHLDGEAALFASADEQLELLDVVRHRAQAAVLQYSLLAKVMLGGNRLSDSTRSLSSDTQYLRLLRRWFDTRSFDTRSVLPRWGSDFAAAIELQTRITEQLGKLLLRVGSQRSPSAAVDRPDADWGLLAGRTRLLKVLYGGELSATSYGVVFRQRHQFVRADVRRPQVGVLLGLARRADHLWLRRSEQAFRDTRSPLTAEGFSFVVDTLASGARIYEEVERDLRRRQCELGKQPFCGAELPAATEDFLLRTTHGILPEDAEALARQLGDAIPSRTRVVFGPPTEPTQVFIFTGAFHVIGEHEIAEESGYAFTAPRGSESPRAVASGRFGELRLDS